MQLTNRLLKKDATQRPVAAGLAVVAADTGRVLMIQRPLSDDPNSGKWEFPGGRIEDGETPIQAAFREWEEETGLESPGYSRSNGPKPWASSDGKYVGYVLAMLDGEDSLDLNNRDFFSDPDSEVGGVIAWVHPRDLPNHNLRPALLNDVDEVLARITKWLLGQVTKSAPLNILKARRKLSDIGEHARLLDIWMRARVRGQNENLHGDRDNPYYPGNEYDTWKAGVNQRVFPFEYSPSRKSAPVNRLKASFFETCDRDEGGQCIAGTGGGGSGGNSTEPESKPSDDKSSASRKHVVQSILSSVGSAAVSLKDAAKGVASKIGQAAWDKLSPESQQKLAKTYQLAKAVEHKVMTGFRAANKLAMKAAEERGASPETAARVGKLLATVDMVSAWTVNMPAALAVTGSASAAKVASWVPVASLAYVGYSTARNPFATVRAARSMIRDWKAKKGKSFSTNVEKAVDQETLAGQLTERIAKAKDPDQWSALFSVAFDELGDPEEAMDAADELTAGGRPISKGYKKVPANVGATVVWNSKTGPVEAEFRGQTMGMDGWEATIIVREEGQSPFQITVDADQIKTKSYNKASPKKTSLIQGGKWEDLDDGSLWDISFQVYDDGEVGILLDGKPSAGEYYSSVGAAEAALRGYGWRKKSLGPVNRLKSSYFEECERDDKGRCTSSGGTSSENPKDSKAPADVPEQVTTSLQNLVDGLSEDNKEYYMHGDCTFFAVAVQEELTKAGVASKLVMVVDDNTDLDDAAYHILTQVGNAYYDAEGWHNKNDVLQDWSKGGRSADFMWAADSTSVRVEPLPDNITESLPEDRVNQAREDVSAAFRQEKKSLKPRNRLKGSYFDECERDDGGHCLPSGEGGAGKTEEDEGKKKPAAKDKPKKAAPGSQLEPKVLAKLKDLGADKLPPADVPASEVKVNLDAGDSGALLTWKQKSRSGRVSQQSAYTATFHAKNAAEKWERVQRIEPVIGAIEKGLTLRMQDKKLPQRQREAAAIASFIRETGLRPTDSAESIKHGHFGISSLQGQHVKVKGDKVHLDFIGKEGVRNQTVMRDPANVAFVKEAMKGIGPKDFLFKEANSGDAIKTLKETSIAVGGPEDILVKDLRTVNATRWGEQATKNFKGPPPPLSGDKKKDAKSLAKAILTMSGEVSKKLNNNPEMARDNYIHPRVFQKWLSTLSSAS